ncbi:MAG: phenylalanine--tRNA ligase subunit beta [Candidatus Omnitrophica bacterium]|nr:phenylalanine--tRNA ligase subunit beta [Candidatus Omnitrophota bacterium]
MRVSLKWLKEFVDVDFSARLLADRLTLAGFPVQSITKPEGARDTVLEVEVLSNRPDCLSIRGIAREVAVLSGKRLKGPKEKFEEGPEPITKWASVTLEDEKKCLRYTARVVTGVKVGASPRWLVERLLAVGIRPVNNIVDITNYCLMELGQPLHAFDLDRLEGRRVIVRRAREGEEFAALDGRKHVLSPEVLVIADARRPVALAGVVGGSETEIGPATRNILIESACFDPIAIRRAVRRTKTGTESSYRFERGIDLEEVPHAAQRAAGLMAGLAGGTVAKGMIDLGKKRERPCRVSVWPKAVDSLVGASIPRKRVEQILTGLGIAILKRERERLWVHIPSWRHDLERPVDCTGEIVRVWGYDRVPSTLPQGRTERPPRPAGEGLVWKVKEALAASGLNEAMTYALLPRETLARSGSGQEGQVLSVANPRSREQEILRPSLLAGMLASASYNVSRRMTDLGFFEVGKVYRKDDAQTPREELLLGILLTGNVVRNWAEKPRAYSVFDLKGYVEHVFSQFQKQVMFQELEGGPSHLPGMGLSILLDANRVGFLGGVRQDVLESFDIKQRLWFGELRLEPLIQCVEEGAGLARPVKAPSRFPSVRYDISLIADFKVRSSEITALIEKEGEAALQSAKLDADLHVTLFDHYQGGNIPKDKRSIAYELHFEPRGSTLVERDVKTVYEAVCRGLSQLAGIQIRQ